MFIILSIDAWRDTEGGWFWNASYKIDTIARTEVENYTARKLLKYMRNANFLSNASKGRVAIEDDGDYITIINRDNGCPLFAIVCDW